MPLGLDMPLALRVGAQGGLRERTSPWLPRLYEALFCLVPLAREMQTTIPTDFVRLGAGTFATVHVSHFWGTTVVKVAHGAGDGEVVRAEHETLCELHRACDGSELFRLPCPLGCYPDFAAFAADMGLAPGRLGSLPERPMYTMERVWPVPPGLSARILDAFVPEASRPDAHILLARLYMGMPGPRRMAFFNTENFTLDADMVERLGLPAADIAKGMGRMLGLINFAAGKDGRDVEFVLCGDRRNPMGKAGYACIDFNQVRPHEGDAARILSSILINDRYYPRPGSRHWEAFAGEYLAVADSLGGGELAREVLDGLQQHEVERAAGTS